uniref:protein-glutamate O-methyltransferase n=1 Tax=Desulfatirhabdium butyrativorans TaxID=340467 RepID=A0A7C4RH12_9BACT
MNPIDHHLSDSDFERLSRCIHQICGIHLTPNKKTLLESRLRKRMRALSLDTFQDYCDYLFSEAGKREETRFMIESVTTHKTDFFREPHHFEYLSRKAIPEMIRSRSLIPGRPFWAWSAACSTGEEPYTLAMVLAEFAASHQDFDYTILATDISTDVLSTAKAAIYNEGQIAPVPLPLRKKYLLKSRDPSRRIVKIVPELRSRIRFQQYNLVDRKPPVNESMNIIFCRNVLIYFDMETQRGMVEKFWDMLHPGGYLFLGHAESINTMSVPFRYVAPTIYRKELQS